MRTEYSSENFEKYTSKNKLKQKMIAKMQRTLIECAGKEINDCGTKRPTLIDVGCGEGMMAAQLHNAFPSLQIMGVDFSEKAVRQAQKTCTGVSFKTGSIYNLDMEDESEDIAICSEVLEHLQEPDRGLDELLRVTRKSLILSVPNEPFFRMGNLLTLNNISRLGEPKSHIQHWTARGFVKWLEEKTKYPLYQRNSFPWTIVVIRKRYM